MLKVIYFDLGGVIFRDLFSGGVPQIANFLDLPEEQVHLAYVKTDLADYSLGKLADTERWQLFADELKLSAKLVDPLVEAFYSIYEPIPETVALVKQLRQKLPHVKRGILSDQPTGVARMLRQRHPDIFSLFHAEVALISSEMGLSKRDPNLRLFQLALKRAAVPAKQILYVDDSAAHLAKAAKLNVPGFHFDITNKNPAALTASLQSTIGEL